MALVAVQTWSSGDKITVSPDASTTLDNFLEYRKSTLRSLYSHDIAELLTLVAIRCLTSRSEFKCLTLISTEILTLMGQLLE